MPKEEWGAKRVCPTTGKHFYDLNADPIVSPYTGEVVTFDANNKSQVAVAEKAAPTDEDDVIDDGDELLADDDDDLNIDDELLDDDDEEDTVSLEEIADVPADDEG